MSIVWCAGLVVSSLLRFELPGQAENRTFPPSTSSPIIRQPAVWIVLFGAAHDVIVAGDGRSREEEEAGVGA